MARPAKVETGFASGRAIDSQISARRYSQTAHTLAGRALKSEFLAKVKTAYIRIVNDLVRTALSQDFPGIDDIGAIGETQRFAHIVVGDQDADAAIGEVAHQILNVADRDRIDARKRFVEQHVVRTRRERARDLDAAAFTAGQRDRRRLTQARDVEFIE